MTEFIIGAVVGIALFVLGAGTLGNAHNESVFKDCSTMGQSRMGKHTIICTPKDTNDNP